MQNFYKSVARQLSRGSEVTMETNIKTGEKAIVNKGAAGISGDILREHLMPKPLLILCGAGHVAKSLCSFAVKLGFDVAVMDDRPEFANKVRFPNAKTLWCAPFDVALDNVPHTDNTYFAVLTRDHAHDAACLERVLLGDYAYAGMIGSKRKNEMVFAELEKHGIPKEKLATVHAPIGLAIKAATPREIAISILAQLIEVRAERRKEEPIDFDVLAALSNGKVRVLATLIEKEGSAPRGAGAKLALMQDGTFIGTVGGGKAEGAVIQAARIMSQTKAPQILDFDMTGKAITDNNMICGGKIKVLLEAIVNAQT